VRGDRASVHRERVDELTFGLHAATVLDHVDLEEAGGRIAPVGEGAHWNAAPDIGRC